MRTRLQRFLVLAVAGLISPAVALSIQVCELDGQHVNPANGHTTAGKTGLMRCRDGDGGPVVREQELRAGAFVGLVRYYKGGALEREFSVNERGNKEGLSREFAAAPGAGNPVVVEETYRNGDLAGLARRWHANGQLKRASFRAEDRREQASAEFTQAGKLAGLKCAAQPQLAPAVDDALWCGHGGKPHTAMLYTEKGTASGSLTHERGQLRARESLWPDGKPRDQMQTDEHGGIERSFSQAGVKLREREWLNLQADGKSLHPTTAQRDYHDNGTLLREQRWKPAERGGSDLQSDQHWYLNGQLKQKRDYTASQSGLVEKETGYHDDGRIAFEGSWVLAGRYDRRAIGVHKTYDDEGRVRLERHHDERGRVSREREFDETGKLLRDDELFEDGSRKAKLRSP